MPTIKEIQEAMERAGGAEYAKRLQELNNQFEASGISEYLSALPRANALPPADLGLLDEPGGAAGMIYSRIERAISDAEEELGDDEALYVTFHPRSGETIIVTSFGYHGPSLLYIYGKDGAGHDCTVLTHPEAAQVLIRVVKRESNEPKRKIGFHGQVLDTDDASEEEE